MGMATAVGAGLATGYVLNKAGEANTQTEEERQASFPGENEPCSLNCKTGLTCFGQKCLPNLKPGECRNSGDCRGEKCDETTGKCTDEDSWSDDDTKNTVLFIFLMIFVFVILPLGSMYTYELYRKNPEGFKTTLYSPIAYLTSFFGKKA